LLSFLQYGATCFNKKFYYSGQIIETTRGCSVGCIFCGCADLFWYKIPGSARPRPFNRIDGFIRTKTAADAMEEVLADTAPGHPLFCGKTASLCNGLQFCIKPPSCPMRYWNVFKECDLRWFGHASFNLMRD